jgi:hypothetical protein
VPNISKKELFRLQQVCNQTPRERERMKNSIYEVELINILEQCISEKNIKMMEKILNYCKSTFFKIRRIQRKDETDLKGINHDYHHNQDFCFEQT